MLEVVGESHLGDMGAYILMSAILSLHGLNPLACRIFLFVCCA